MLEIARAGQAFIQGLFTQVLQGFSDFVFGNLISESKIKAPR